MTALARRTGAFGGVGVRRAEHGTSSGYQQHIAHGTDPCGPCREARSAYMAEWRQRRNERKTPSMNDTNSTTTFTWDYKEQPPLDDIAEAVRTLSGGSVSMVMPETGSDEFELVITAPPPPAVATQRDAYRDERDELRASLSSLLDRTEGSRVLTDDETAEYRALVSAASPAPAGDDPVGRLLALPCQTTTSGRQRSGRP